MDTYVLIVLVALFLGVMGIIAMMERRRRTDLVQTEHLHQTLTACVSWLQTIHSSDEAQMAKVAEALLQLRAAVGSVHAAVESGTKDSTGTAASISSQTLRVVEQSASRLETALQQHQKAVDSIIIRAGDKLSESSAARTKELLTEAQRMTKAVHDLQASLEASTKF